MLLYGRQNDWTCFWAVVNDGEKTLSDDFVRLVMEAIRLVCGFKR